MVNVPFSTSYFHEASFIACSTSSCSTPCRFSPLRWMRARSRLFLSFFCVTDMTARKAITNAAITSTTIYVRLLDDRFNNENKNMQPI